MNLYLLILALLASAVNTTPSLLSSGYEANTTLPPTSLDFSYRCASTAHHEPGRRTPSALDCLNVLTYMLATTANHDLPTEWSRHPASGQTLLPYRRSSGSCQILVQLTKKPPAPTTETATFDEVIGAGLRITEVCLLSSRRDIEHWGGAALAGSSRYLDVIVWGTPIYGGNNGVQSNATVELDETGEWVTGVS
jgi:hypothetical protein